MMGVGIMSDESLQTMTISRQGFRPGLTPRITGVSCADANTVLPAAGSLARRSVRSSFGGWGFGIGLVQSTLWAGGAALVGLALAALTILFPAWRNARQTSIAAARVVIGRQGSPWWERIGVDMILLAGAGLVFSPQAQGGYELVLVPEGTPRVSVSYPSFLAPLLLWAGAALLIVRLTRLALG